MCMNERFRIKESEKEVGMKESAKELGKKSLGKNNWKNSSKTLEKELERWS